MALTFLILFGLIFFLENMIALIALLRLFPFYYN